MVSLLTVLNWTDISISTKENTNIKENEDGKVTTRCSSDPGSVHRATDHSTTWRVSPRRKTLQTQGSVGNQRTNPRWIKTFFAPINDFFFFFVAISKKIEVKPVHFGKDTLSNKEQRQKVKKRKKP